MEDVVLHYRSGSAEGLESLLETSEKLLEPFPCRPPPVFTCWFPAAADRHRPIRPVKPAPVIASSDVSHSRPRLENQSESRRADGVAAETQKPKGGVSEEQTSPVRRSRSVSEEQTSPVRRSRSVSEEQASPVRRSWSVFRQTEVLLQSSMSRRFLHMVSVNKLHLRQRAKWVIREQNWESRDIEQVWRTLIRSVRSSGLPSFNANIQRQRAEIWVFCDVVNGEQVGRHLKEELQLKGRISLSVRRLGNVFSL